MEYPVAEEEEKSRHQSIEKYQAHKASLVPELITHDSTLSKILKSIAVIALIITLFLAGKVMFGSATENMYLENRIIFYRYAFICTLVYFTTAYWVLQRGKLKADKS